MTPAIDSLSQSPSFVDAMNGMALLDRDGRFIKANHRFCSILERNEAELRGLALSQFVEPEDLLAYTSSVEEARISSSVQDEIVCRLRAKSGKTKPAKMAVKRLAGEDGSFLCFFSQATEIDPIVPRAAKAQNLEWGSFVRQNWKSIVTVITVLLGAAYNEWSSYQNMQATVLTNQRTIATMAEVVEQIADALDIPIGPED